MDADQHADIEPSTNSSCLREPICSKIRIVLYSLVRAHNIGRMHLKLKPRPWRMLLLLILSSFLVAFGFFLTSEENSVLGWFFVGMFGLAILRALISLLPSSNYLDIRPDGMEIRSDYKNWFVPWADVKSFFPAYVYRRSRVCWYYASSPSEQRLARKIISGLVGCEAALPDAYGMRTEDLCNLLNEWREKHVVAS